MPLQSIVIDTGPRPTAAIIVLHGLGADGNDFAPFAKQIDLSSVGHVRWVFPHAPTIPVTINNGQVMRAWYDIFGGFDAGRREDEAGLRLSQAAVGEVVAQQRAAGIEAKRIVLGGFSQGCAMALLAGLRHPERLAGIVGMSGYLPLATALANERSPANAEAPIFLAHGTADAVVPLARGVATRDVLQTLGYPVEWHAYPMQHSVCPAEVVDLRAWLLRVLG